VLPNDIYPNTSPTMPLEQSVALPRKLWEHPDPKNTRMYRFLQSANTKYNLSLQTFHDLYDWSVGPTRNDFWRHVWDEIDLIYEGSYQQPVDLTARMDSIPSWFEGVRLNYAENMLYSRGNDPGERGTLGKEDSKIAITEVREGATEIRDFTWAELRRRVGLLANAMRTRGVKKGDRVAVVASNSIDTLCVFMAVTAIGGLFSSSSTDMGTKGIMDRLLQIEPVWVFVDDWAVYNGKTIDLRPKITDIVQGLKSIKNFKGVVTLPRFAQPADLAWVPRAITLKEYLEAAEGDSGLRFERVEYRDPFLVVYSSGTTGIPKCIVHSVGGVLTNAMKEGKIHRDIGPATVGMQYTTVSPRNLKEHALKSFRPGGSCIYRQCRPYSTVADLFFMTVHRSSQI
jgi:acetoacetyl-CoA synthetase